MDRLARVQGSNEIGINTSTRAKLKRRQWGLNWNVALETGGWLVGDDIHVSIDLEIVKQPETVPGAAAPSGHRCKATGMA